MQKPYLILCSLVSIVGILVLTICLKHHVHNLHDELAILDKQITEEKMVIHVLNAELAYLSRPERLQDLNDKYLKFVAINREQVEYMDKSATNSLIAQNINIPETNNEVNGEMNTMGNDIVHKVSLKQ